MGIVDLLAIRKGHRPISHQLNRGDAFEIVLVQVKGGSAAKPTAEDAKRLMAVGDRYHAAHLLFAVWKKGRQAEFFDFET